MSHASKTAVITAISANALVTTAKFIAAFLGNSASMMNEAVHSLMDTLNQAFLFMGLTAAEKPSDEAYAFGHGQKKYLWNLWSAIGLFSIGAGLGLAHAWHSWHLIGHQETADVISVFGFDMAPIWLNLGVLAFAVLLEGYSFLVAMKEFLIRMRAEGFSNPLKYLGNADDPTLTAVVLEDSVAVFGLVLAAIGIGLAELTGDPRWDIIFSVLIALMLGAIAFYLGWVNMRYLTDIRDEEAEEIFAQVVREHPQVERYHDLRSIILDENHTILVAEVELREEAVTARLLPEINEEKQRMMAALPAHKKSMEETKEYVAVRAAVQAVLERTEKIVQDLVTDLKKRAPKVAHATIEVTGIAAPSSKHDV